MGLSIHLLGSPRIERGGRPVDAARGHKAWGLLAYLVRSRIPPSRERLAGLLFPEADDPLRALRWTLVELRRQLGADAELGGNPLRLALPRGTFVDVDVLSRGSWMEAIALPGLGHELLDGLTFRSSPGFEMWLEDERRHVLGTTSAVLHQAALALLGRGDPAAAARHASELVRLNPFEENAHVLLVRCLRAAGDADAATRQVEACTDLFRRELGIEPTPALRTANAASAAVPTPRVSGRASVLAQLEAGDAALAAGAVEAGYAAPTSRGRRGSRHRATASSSPRRWWRWAGRSSTRPAAPTRKAPRRCTKGPCSPSRSSVTTSPRRGGARSHGSSSCARITSERRSRWPTPPSSPPETTKSSPGSS